MSRPQDPHRPFFPFGNPFRVLSPKGPQLSPKLLVLLMTFEETLAESFGKLNSKVEDDVVSFSWMKLAMESLCETHNDIKVLISDLELHMSEWDKKWVDLYLDISIKLLDICNIFSSELSRLNQGQLMLKCGLHSLNSYTADQFARARSSLDGWMQHINLRNSRVESCFTALSSLLESLDLPKVKNSAKGNVLMRAFYGVQVKTMFICSVFAAALSGSAKKLVHVKVTGPYRWAQAFTDLQSNLNDEIRNVCANGRFTPLKELEVVDSSVRKLIPMIQHGMETSEMETCRTSASDLESKTEKLSKGLDLLTEQVDGFFRIVLSGRDALMSNLGPSGTVSDMQSGEWRVR